MAATRPTKETVAQRELERLGSKTAAQVESLWRQVVAGRYDRDKYVTTAAEVVRTANQRGQTLSRTLLTRELAELLGEKPATLNAGEHWVRAFLEPERLIDALTTILDGDDDEIPMRLSRFGNSEPIRSSQAETSALIRSHPQVIGWVRQLEPNACQLCEWWWREGRVWDKDHGMPEHTGCLCHQEPVTVSRG